MTDRNDRDTHNNVAETIERQADRMEQARRESHRNILFGLGMFGVVGWSVAIPTVAGIFLGLWLDRSYPVGFSWTLTLLFVGVVVGIIVALRWVNRIRKES